MNLIKSCIKAWNDSTWMPKDKYESMDMHELFEHALHLLDSHPIEHWFSASRNRYGFYR